MIEIENDTPVSAKPLSLRDLADKRTDELHVNPDLLQIREGWNTRDQDTPENMAHIEKLAMSIARIGVQTPLTVHSSERGVYYVTDGHCRLAAVKLAIERGAPLKTIPVRLEARSNSEADRLLGQIVRNGGKPLESLEMANVFKRLLDMGEQAKDIAEKAGMSVQQVNNLVGFRADAPTEVTDAVRKGDISLSVASKVVKEAKGDRKLATERVAKAVDNAKAKGAKRATAKHLEGKVSSTMALSITKSILKRAEVMVPPTDTGIIGLKITAEDWDRLKAAIGIKG